MKKTIRINYDLKIMGGNEYEDVKVWNDILIQLVGDRYDIVISDNPDYVIFFAYDFSGPTSI